MEITTDGAVDAKESVENAAKILNGYFKQIYDPTAEEEVTEVSTNSTLSDDVLRLREEI